MLVDRLVAVGLFLLAQVELWSRGAVGGPRVFGVAMVTLGTLPLAWRRSYPVLVLTAVIAAQAIPEATVGTPSSAAIAGAWVFALYAVSVWTQTRRFLAGIGLECTYWLVSVFTVGSSGGSLSHATRGFAWLVVPLLLMLLVRSVVRGREVRVEALAARAEAAEREAELLAREAVAAERAMIARELHDVVAHSVSVMVVQAGAERVALPPELAATAETLRAIELSGREALVELRRLLGVLRGGERDPLEPQPTVADIDRLLEQVREAGVEVSLAVEGSATRLPRGVELSAYRIVQEALTNVLKHATGAHADVRLRYQPDMLEIEVHDSGGAQTGEVGGGHGLLGMRERAALHGGTVVAGPEPDGGFLVRARLPVLA